jgi:talin
MASALTDLSAAIGPLRDIMTSQPTRQSAIHAAVDQIEALQNDVVGIKKSLVDGSLVPLPGESVESSSAQLGAVSKTLGSAMAQLLTAAAQVSLRIILSSTKLWN